MKLARRQDWDTGLIWNAFSVLSWNAWSGVNLQRGMKPAMTLIQWWTIRSASILATIAAAILVPKVRHGSHRFYVFLMFSSVSFVIYMSSLSLLLWQLAFWPSGLLSSMCLPRSLLPWLLAFWPSGLLAFWPSGLLANNNNNNNNNRRELQSFRASPRRRPARP